MDIVDEARALLAEKGDAGRAAENKKYFKSPFLFLGVTKKDINAIGGKLKRRLKGTKQEDLLGVLQELWSSGVHEEMSLAVVLAALFVENFCADDVKEVFSTWLDECQTWDHIDELCIRVTGRLALNDASLWPVIEGWATSEHMWKRRAALISHLPAIRAQSAYIESLERTCRTLAGEREFFIRKAIGWVLREFADHNRDRMVTVFQRIGKDLSSLTQREATRKLDPAIREALLGPTKQRAARVARGT